MWGQKVVTSLSGRKGWVRSMKSFRLLLSRSFSNICVSNHKSKVYSESITQNYKSLDQSEVRVDFD